MNGVWLTSYEVTLFFGRSALFGTAAGAFYDIFRIIRISRKPKGEEWAKHRFLRFGDTVLCFVGDILFWLTLAVCYSIFIYHTIEGRLRLGSIASGVAGFLIWHLTAGRLIVFLADRIIALVRRIIAFIISVTLVPLGRAFCFIGKKAGELAGLVFGAVFHKVIWKREIALASKGFKINKFRIKKKK